MHARSNEKIILASNFGKFYTIEADNILTGSSTGRPMSSYLSLTDNEKIIDGFRMSKDTDLEKKIRLDAIEDATKYATEIPFKVMETSFQSMEIMQAMLKDGLKNSLSDAGVGVLCARAAVIGAYFNVRINAKDIKDRDFATVILNKAATIYKKTIALEQETISFIDSQM